MKANELVKKLGWNTAKEALTMACDKLKHVNYKNHAVLISDLKRLVESHELVESIGGLEFAKNFIKITGSTIDSTLEKAITDVESCQ